MTTEQILILLTSIGAAVWALIKVVIPKIIEAKIEDAKDTREYSQELEKSEMRYRQLQDSWTKDKLTDILEQNESFIRDSIHQDLQQIKSKMHQMEMTVAQVRDIMSIVTMEIRGIKDAIEEIQGGKEE